MKYAIVESGGKQYKAVEGLTIDVDRLPVEAGANIKLEQVLLLADGEQVTVGTPMIKDTRVWAKVIEHFKGSKVVIFNYRPKKRIRVKTGHRQYYTRLMIEQIGGAALTPRKEAAQAAKPEATEAIEGKPKERQVSRAEAKVEKKPAKAPSVKTTVKTEAIVEKKPVKTSRARPEGKKPVKTAPTKPAAKKTAEKKATKPAPAKGKKPSSK